MKKAMVILAAALLVFSLSACGTQAPGTTQPAGTGEAKLEGTISVNGSTSVGPVIEALADQFMELHEDVVINIDQTGSGTGISAIGDKTCDIGMSSRELKDTELAKGIDTHELCIDGIAIIVNAQNSAIAGLSKEQVKQIYMGEITNWSQIGGADAPINLYSRESTSGTRGAFEELVLGKDGTGAQITIDDSKVQIQTSNGNLAAAVGQDAYGIGYMSLGLVKNYATVKATDLDNVHATLDNIVNGTYTLKRPFLLLTNGTPSSVAQAFLDYCLTSEAAKQYMAEKGYVAAE